MKHFEFEKDRRITEVNYMGALAWLDPVAAMFHRLKAGQIVGISSVAGERGRVGTPAYNASKAALTCLPGIPAQPVDTPGCACADGQARLRFDRHDCRQEKSVFRHTGRTRGSRYLQSHPQAQAGDLYRFNLVAGHVGGTEHSLDHLPSIEFLKKPAPAA